jgi:proton-translocating NADH-quinone oxidoreductase chain N
LDVLLIFMITTPVIGWVAYKKVHRKILSIYVSMAFVISIVLLYNLYTEVVEKGIVLIGGKPPFNILLGGSLRIDMLSIFMAFLYTIMGLFVSIYSRRYMEHDTGLTEYYTLLVGLIAGMMGVAFSGDFFTLFVFWELMCLTSYALVAFRKHTGEPIEAGFKYIIMSAAGGATILLAMSFLYGMTGTLSFAGLATRLTYAAPDGWLYITLTLVIVGFGVKAAVVPFHTWLPDAHSAAPSPISAVLSGVMVQTGAYALIRILMVAFGSIQPVWQVMLGGFAVFTMFGGNLMALLQDDLKRLLAFSTIAHMGYVVLGLATASQQGWTASLFHIMNHAIMKCLLFLCAGAFFHRTKTRDLKQLSGIRKTMPKTSIFFAIGTLAIAAIPPLNGFWSEWMIMAAGIEANMVPLSILMLINMIFSVVYYLRVIRVIFLEPSTARSNKATEAPVSMLIPILVLAALCIIIGIYPEPFITMASRAAQALNI